MAVRSEGRTQHTCFPAKHRILRANSNRTYDLRVGLGERRYATSNVICASPTSGSFSGPVGPITTHSGFYVEAGGEILTFCKIEEKAKCILLMDQSHVFSYAPRETKAGKKAEIASFLFGSADFFAADFFAL